MEFTQTKYHAIFCDFAFTCGCKKFSLTIEFLQDEVHKSREFWLHKLPRWKRWIIRKLGA